MKIEYELRILNLNKKEIAEKLISIGAKKVHDEIMQKIYVMDFPDNRLHKKHSWLRIRSTGNAVIECSIKQRIDNTSVRNAQEIEMTISDLEIGRELFEFLGLRVITYKEKKREKYQKNGVIYDIDTWPGKNSYLEIESTSEEKVRSGAAELGFEEKDFTYMAGGELLKVLGFDTSKDIRF